MTAPRAPWTAHAAGAFVSFTRPATAPPLSPRVRVRPQRWCGLQWVRLPISAVLIAMMTLFGGMVTLYCIVCFALTAIVCVPVMDLSTTVAAALPFGWPRYKQRDLIVIEQYKATRYMLQVRPV